MARTREYILLLTDEKLQVTVSSQRPTKTLTADPSRIFETPEAGTDAVLLGTKIDPDEIDSLACRCGGHYGIAFGCQATALLCDLHGPILGSAHQLGML